jgi:uncharacterized protein (TIGR01777 family)
LRGAKAIAWPNSEFDSRFLNRMHIGLTGATGFVGKKLIDVALRRGHEIVAFTRQPEKTIPGCEMRRFSLDAPPEIGGCEALVHLAGEPVAGIWTGKKKREIVESRVLGTRRVAEAIQAARVKPEVLVSGSAVGFYGDRGEEELTESAAPGSGFLAEAVKAWEAEARRAEGLRVVLLRTSIVLGRKGGALAAMEPAFKIGLGGVLGNGRQWMPWIHLDDLASLILFAIENMDVAGPLNASAPWPVRNAEFTKTLAGALHRPAFFRVPSWALKAALGGFSAELLESKRVLPAMATEHGFGFRFSELPPALANLCGGGE